MIKTAPPWLSVWGSHQDILFLRLKESGLRHYRANVQQSWLTYYVMSMITSIFYSSGFLFISRILYYLLCISFNSPFHFWIYHLPVMCSVFEESFAEDLGINHCSMFPLVLSVVLSVPHYTTRLWAKGDKRGKTTPQTREHNPSSRRSMLLKCHCPSGPSPFDQTGVTQPHESVRINIPNGMRG